MCTGVLKPRYNERGHALVMYRGKWQTLSSIAQLLWHKHRKCRQFYAARWTAAGKPGEVNDRLLLMPTEEVIKRFGAAGYPPRSKPSAGRRTQPCPALDAEAKVMQPICIPQHPSDEYMRPYRRLAARVIAEAVLDLDRPDLGVRKSGGQSKTQITRTYNAANDWLTGKKNRDDLNFWVDVVGGDSDKIVEMASTDQRKLIDLYKQYIRSSGRKTTHAHHDYTPPQVPVDPPFRGSASSARVERATLLADPNRLRPAGAESPDAGIA